MYMKRRLNQALFVTVISLSPFVSVQAHNLGVQGHTFPIGEIDMRLLEAKSLARVNVHKIKHQMLKSTRSYPSSLPQYSLPPVRRTSTRYVNLTTVLNKNIMGMKQNAKGHWVWSVLWKKGTRINPLKRVRPHTALLYFNAQSRQQTRFALKLFDRFPSRVSLVETQGNPVALSNRLKKPVFYAQKKSLKRFQVRKTPSLVIPGIGKHRYRLRITVFGQPYSGVLQTASKIINATWGNNGVTQQVVQAAIKNYGTGGKK